jgi:FkbM family methyltransferase
MHGATGNIYLGLHEFDEMTFVLHALRASDLFVDVGANVGSYTILAAGAVGSRVIAIEPDAAALVRLRDNLHLNRVEALVDVHQAIVGDRVGSARITTSHDTTNRVVVEEGPTVGEPLATVPMTTLDTILSGRDASLIKIDVEGFEAQVLAGAGATLNNPRLRGIIMETNPNVAPIASKVLDTDAYLREHGFFPCRYDGSTRRLDSRHERRASSVNTVYVRDIPEMAEYCRTSPRFHVLDTYV